MANNSFLLKCKIIDHIEGQDLYIMLKSDFYLFLFVQSLDEPGKLVKTFYQN